MMDFQRKPFENYALTITDSELLAYLYAIEPSQQERYVLTALRIGFATLNESKGEIDRQRLHDMAEHLASTLQQHQGLMRDQLHHWSANNGPLDRVFSTHLQRLEHWFNPENPKSASSQVSQIVAKELSKLSQEWSFDQTDSAFTRLQHLLTKHTARMTKEMQQLFGELKQIQQEAIIRKDEAMKGTRHGGVFEECLNEYLLNFANSHGHLYEGTGDTTGLIKNCKVGDGVLTLSKEHVAAGANIVVEAKQSKSYTIKKALEELTLAQKNRQADVGIFVMSTQSANSKWPKFQRYDHQLIVTWDADTATTDWHLDAALSIATALCSKKQYTAAELPDFLPMQQAVMDLEKQMTGCDEIAKLAGTIASNSEKIRKRIELMGTEARAKIADLERCVDQLRKLDFAVIE